MAQQIPETNVEISPEYPAIPQTTYEFFEDFIECIQRVEVEAGIMTMHFEEGPATGEMLDELLEAHERGVSVHIDFDPYVHRMTRVWNRDVMRGIPLLHQEDRRERDHNRLLSGKRLLQLGELGILHIPDRPSLLRSPTRHFAPNHIKLAYADDAAWIMTGNLTDPDIYLPGWRGDADDYRPGWDASHMIGMHNSAVRLVRRDLVEAVKQVAKLACSETNTGILLASSSDDYALMTSAGRRKRSPIYERALEMVDRAEEQIFFISQYPPDGPLLAALKQKAQQDVFVAAPAQTRGDHRLRRFPYNVMNAVFKLKTMRSGDNFCVEERVNPSHNKALIVDEKEILFGSDNLLYALSRYVGSQEFSLWSNDELFVSGMLAMLSSLELGGGFHSSPYDKHGSLAFLGL